ncbi:E5b protein [Caenorhabditis elegans]|uniref:E5b protein n=1 Tax=Caenorhabditis elegans TaxID=6239 RepID=H2KZC4_CAEEL|nr:E5b protein [Caenorhabditis elegans]CCD67562.1 E5b protein [Caenorhabditis elegans]|eukprot:NP_001024988.1 Uncharacterized protein CELE_ZK154.6 [Caenorhabditis elegans]
MSGQRIIKTCALVLIGHLVMSAEDPAIWESILALDIWAIIVWVYDHLPFEIKSYIWMVILTLLFVVFLTTCCGVLCFFAPCCCCAIMYKGYRARRAGRRPRNETDNIAYPSAPPLLAKV